MIILKLNAFHLALKIFFSDVDECLNPSSCDTNANCANTIGSWTCSCKPGFFGDGSPGNCIG